VDKNNAIQCDGQCRSGALAYPGFSFIESSAAELVGGDEAARLNLSSGFFSSWPVPVFVLVPASFITDAGGECM